MQEGVSVIMTFYNEKLDWIKESISSILNQTHDNLELLIVCDNPGDKVLFNQVSEYVNNDKRVRLFRNEKNIGLAKSLNFAIKQARFKYIARMDADDVADIERLSIQLNTMLIKEADIIGTNCILIDAEGNELGFTSYPINPKTINTLLPYTNCLAHPTWLARKTVFIELGGYFDYKCSQDYDLLLRARNKKFKLINTDDNLLRYRVRENSIGNSKALNQYLTAKHIRKINKNKSYDETLVRNFDLSAESNRAFLDIINSSKNIGFIGKLSKELLIPFRNKYGFSYLINLYQTRIIKLSIARK